MGGGWVFRGRGLKRQAKTERVGHRAVELDSMKTFSNNNPE